MTAAAARPPLSFAAFPVASWVFAIRIWLALVAALYASFWLQLESPSSAAICVAILALPTRGQALEKAGFRLSGTVIGVVAAIAITGLFSQATELLLVAFAVWMGICVYATGLSDGNRAYAATLCGYTMALIAIQHTDAPQQVFESGLARGAAIVVGIVAIAIVNDLLVAPDRHPGLLAQLTALHRRVRAHAGSIARGETVDAAATNELLREIAVLRSDITSLVAERAGWTGTLAARSAVAALVAQIHAARALSALPLTAAPRLREQLVKGLDGATDISVTGEPGALHDVSAHDEPAKPLAALDLPALDLAALHRAALHWATAEVMRRDRHVVKSIAALEGRRRPAEAWLAPRYRSQRIALAMGLRAAVWMGLAAGALVTAGWPAAQASLALVAVMIGLGALGPDPRGTTMGALIAIPLAAVLAGILEFLVLDGVNSFPLLALALAPSTIGLGLLMTLPSPRLASMGRLCLIFSLAIFSPANPPAYDPQAFLFTSLFAVVAVALLLAGQYFLPPVSPAQRRRWLVGSARSELAHLCARAPVRKGLRGLPEAAMFRDAMRIAQIAPAVAADAEARIAEEDALALFDRAGFVRLGRAALARIAASDKPSAVPDAIEYAQHALSAQNPALMETAALQLHEAASGDFATVEAAVTLLVASRVMARPLPEIVP